MALSSTDALASEASTADPGPVTTLVARRRLLWLALALALQLLAVGGRWDISWAAWLYPIFLLRFARESRLAPALAGVWLVSALGGAFWFVQMAVPFALIPLLGVIALASVVSLAFVFDRFVNGSLPLLGRLLAFPATLVSMEYLLGVFSPFGTAYGLIAVTQHAHLGLLQAIAVIGPYGIAFLIGLVATSVNHWWEGGFLRADARIPIIVLVTTAAVVALGQARLGWLAPDAPPTVRVAGINPGLAAVDGALASSGAPDGDSAALAAADREPVRESFAAINDALIDDTEASAASGAQVVVWSEQAARVLVEDEGAFLEALSQVADRADIYLNAAMNVILDEAPYNKNQAVLAGPDGDILWTYEKSRPIPGMETAQPGPGEVPVVETPFGRLATVICFDADFPALTRVDADLMLVPGFDWPEMGWIHTRMSSLRAIENGYALVRQDFNGSSQAFDRYGNLVGLQDTTADNGTWFVDVPVEQGGSTPYGAMGDLFSWLALLMSAGLAVLAIRRRRSPAPTG